MSTAQICKLCSQDSSQTTFENAPLCIPCYKKAVHAAKNPKLCAQCNGLFTQKHIISDLFSDYGFEHSSASYLRASVEDGCGMCRMMWLQEPNPDPGRLQFINLYLKAERPKGACENENYDCSYAGDVNLLHFSSEEGQFRLNMSVSAFPDDPAARYIGQRPPEENLGNERTTQLVRGWLNECLKSHSDSLSDDLPRLPTRVIDVGTAHTDIRLLETPPDLRSHYITLSYCWGRPHFLTTLLANAEEHKKGLDFDSLPLTFRDAIVTVRNLGFRYIWIDALCIIQDSNEDKAREIGKMGDIYGDSALTIAVVSAQAVAEGFLKTKALQFVDLPYRCPDGVIGSVRVTLRKESDLWDESLYTRAWCLQENLLSSRLLLYTDTEVVWQCQSVHVSRPPTTHVAYVREDPTMGGSPFNRLPIEVLRPLSPVKAGDDQNRARDTERYDIWSSLVENYTRRNLTMAGDRLPALSGIAQKFQDAWDDIYIAGIWERQLLPSLAWKRSMRAGQPHYPQLTEHRAPSWSWASIDGPVEFDTRYDLGNARGLGAKAKTCVDDVNNKNTDAVILEAYIIPVTSLPDPKSSWLGNPYFDDHDIDKNWPKIGDTIDDLNDEMRSICLCLLLGEGKHGSGKMMKTTALIIMPASDQDENTFTRIGLWESFTKGTSKLWIGAKNKRVLRII